MSVRVANAPCSWGVLEFELGGEAAGAERVLAEMAEAGYAGTELGDWGFLPAEPDPLRALLARHRLELVGAFVPVALAEPDRLGEGVGRALRTARLVAAVSPSAVLVLSDDNAAVPARLQHAGRIGPGMGLDGARWDRFAAGAERIARAVRDEVGLRTVFHHHAAGYVETPEEIEALMTRTDPALLGLCLDTGHLALGGGDPLAALERYADRVWHVHFKGFDGAVAARAREEGWDYFRAVREGVFCELEGTLGFAAITTRLRERGYDGWIVVEQDVLPGMGTPLESARRSRAYLERIGL